MYQINEFIAKNGFISQGNATINGFLSATTFSANTVYVNTSISATTLSANTIFSPTISATTISATTFVGLPAGLRVTGATNSNNIFTFTNDSGGTFSTLFNTVTGLTVNGILSATTISGNTIYSPVISATTLSANTLYVNSSISATTLSANTIYSPIISATTISATTYIGMMDIYVTGATNSNNIFTFTNNTGGTFNTLFNTVTGLTVNGTVKTNILSATTLSANTIYSPVISATTISATTISATTIISGITHSTDYVAPTLFAGSVTGFINGIAGNHSTVYYSLVGKVCYVIFNLDGANPTGTTVSFTVPYTVVLVPPTNIAMYAMDNGVVATTSGTIDATVGTKMINLYPTNAGGTWSGVGGRRVANGQFFYFTP